MRLSPPGLSFFECGSAALSTSPPSFTTGYEVTQHGLVPSFVAVTSRWSPCCPAKRCTAVTSISLPRHGWAEAAVLSLATWSVPPEAFAGRVPFLALPPLPACPAVPLPLLVFPSPLDADGLCAVLTVWSLPDAF